MTDLAMTADMLHVRNEFLHRLINLDVPAEEADMVWRRCIRLLAGWLNSLHGVLTLRIRDDMVNRLLLEIVESGSSLDRQTATNLAAKMIDLVGRTLGYLDHDFSYFSQ